MRRLWIMTTVCLLWAAAGLAEERMSVSADIANIRSGPGTDYDVLWQVQENYPISVLKRSGAWYHFRDFEGDEGWIHRSLVAEAPAVITVKEKCNVRSGPGTDHGILFSVGKGIPFRMIGKEGGWVHIQHADGDKGWIHQSLVW